MQSNKNIEAFNSINEKLCQLPKIVPQHSIYRVHKELRDVNSSAYEPQLVAIGPYHHGKGNFKMMEEHKLRYFQLLLESQKQNVGRYISAIEELEQKARDCYAEPISLSGAQFVEMLVLDGCFIIELLRKCYSQDSAWENDPILQTRWVITTLVRDLILFENQIPFFVLCKLFDLIEGQNKHEILTGFFLHFCWTWGAFTPRLKFISFGSSQEIKHLIDMVYKNWLSSNDTFVDIERRLPDPLKELKFIPPAIELKNANVEFRTNQSDTLFEVKFENGTMEMPPLRIQDGTECLLRNLIVHEQYFRKGELNFVTDYIILLNCLINSSRDVEILSKCGIMDDWLGDKEAVANIINRLGISIVRPGESFFYTLMFDDVNKHYQKRRNRWVATLKNDIFHSPWAYISFFAALAILMLTTVQAVCSILQVV